MEARIALLYDDERKAKAVAEAVSPDNVKTPAGVTVQTLLEGKEVTTVIKCEKSVKTLKSTIDDLLSCVRVAEKCLEAMSTD